MERRDSVRSSNGATTDIARRASPAACGSGPVHSRRRGIERCAARRPDERPARTNRRRHGEWVFVDPLRPVRPDAVCGRGTYDALEAIGARTIGTVASMILGSVGEEFFRTRGIPVVAVVRDEFEIWRPGDCPLCDVRGHEEDIAAAAS